MKTLKNDTRYIIKRVLIGVLIAIVLFNARKCGIYADTISSYKNFNLTNNNLNATWVVNTSSSFNCSYGQKYTFEYETIQYNICINNKDAQYTPSMMINVFEYNSNLYLSYLSMSNDAFNNMVKFDYTLSYATDNVTGRVDYVVTYNTNSTVGANVFNLAPNYQPNGNYNNKFINISTYPTRTDLTATDLITNNLYEDLNLVYTNTNKPIYINNVEIVPPSTFPPSGYSELDLTGYQGVIFVPKNYSTMNYNQLYNLDFNYYYKGRVRDGYFLLNNSNQHYYDTDILISDDDYTERNGFYTLAKVQTTEGITATTTIEYSAFVVYNSSPTGDWQGDILPPYGETYIVYDSTLYDYYLVEDFSTFNQTICFYDFENNQICINVESLPTLNDILIDANSSTTNEDIPQQKINYILEFLKLPIRSLRRVAEGTCEAITLPIPIIGGTIQLNCLSSLFQNVLGGSFEFFRLIINGLLLYRITIHNIKVFKDVLDPSNTGIEVVNL